MTPSSNPVAAAQDGTGSIVARFAEWARYTPNATAVVAGTLHASYAELDSRSTELAIHIEGHGKVIALALCGGPCTVVAMLAILKAGCAYLPLDPTAPTVRRESIMADSAADAAVICVHTGQAADFEIRPCEPVTTGSAGTAESTPPDPDLAYILYTSGSTGHPKGVPVCHRHLSNLVDSGVALFDFTQHDVWLQYNSLTFDFSTWEIWMCLLTGGTLVCPSSRERLHSGALAALLARERISVLNVVPPVFRRLCDNGLTAPELRSLRLLFFGGDTFNPSDFPVCRELINAASGPDIVNLYGLTESTVVVSAHRVSVQDIDRSGTGSFIGTPLPHLTVAVLDTATGLAHPAGEVGEICVWGSSVVGAYWRRPRESAERFSMIPGVPSGGRPVLRTGDRGFVDPSTGFLVHCDRLDNQVKVGAVRIEPEGVENVLRRFPGIADAVVGVVTGTGYPFLRAVLEPVGSAIADPVAVRSFLRTVLPVQEIPADVVVCRRLPLLPSGKVDRVAALRAALPDG